MLQHLKRLIAEPLPTMAGAVTNTPLRQALRERLRLIYSAAPKGNSPGDSMAIRAGLAVASQLVERTPDADLVAFIKGVHAHATELAKLIPSK